MRILIVGGLLPRDPRAGGGELAAYELAHALATAGHRVHYLSRKQAAHHSAEETHGYVHILEATDASWHCVVSGCLKGDCAGDYDVIHVHAGPGTLVQYVGLALRRCAKRDIKLALTIHAPKVHAFPRSLDEVGWMLGCRAADVILAVSEFSSRDIARCYRINRAKIAVVYNGVDTEVFHPLRTPGHRGRGVSTLVFCGRLNGTRQKGLEVLLDAMSLILQRHDVLLDVIGVGPRMEEYKDHAERLNLNGRVRFLGFVEHNLLPEYFAQADLVVLPSRRESFGLVLAEAMACGLPVVATTAGAIPEVVEDGVTGVLVPPDDPEALASAVVSLLSDPERMTGMGKAGAERAGERFTWDKVAERVIGAYHLALGMVRPAGATGNRR